jgi:hypothetical protein
LSHDSIVTVVPNRGAFVSSPTVEEAREVFAARRLIEPDLIRQATRMAQPGDIQRLREHVAKESTARAANDKRAIIRLSGEFHQVIAETAGNRFLAKTMRELETLTCLVIILYDAPNVPACPYHEHSDWSTPSVARRRARSDADGRAPAPCRGFAELSAPVTAKSTSKPSLPEAPHHAPARRQRQHLGRRHRKVARQAQASASAGTEIVCCDRHLRRA